MAKKEEKKEDVQKSPIEKAGFVEEVAEEFNASNYGAYVKTGFPQPIRRFRLVFESQQASMEHTYFWVYNHARQDMGFGDVIKTLDTFSASENSSFWGATEQRKGLQQDKASQYLGVIGRMVKELFQIVREIRILRERLSLYKGSTEGKQADDIALKGYWVDMVEGGTKGGANIYVMANQLGFGTLPDLFFSTFIKDGDDVSTVVDVKAKDFNDKVKEVLKRKLATYMAWKKETYSELLTRERFTLRYLRQHWAIIKMYMSWVKPYLRNVQKLQAPDKFDRNPELISSFEGALMEIEFLARRPMGFKDGKGDDKKQVPTILATFSYRVKPQMQFQADSYQNRGPIHIGRVEVSLRCYGWTKDDMEAYVRSREQETMDLIGMVDSSVKDAMDALGDELTKYLKDAGEDIPDAKKEEKKDAPKPPFVNIYEPFKALFGGFKEMATLPFGDLFTFTEAKKPSARGENVPDGVIKATVNPAFQIYKNYKKAHGMPAW